MTTTTMPQAARVGERAAQILRAMQAHPGSPLPGLRSLEQPMIASAETRGTVSVPRQVFIELLCVTVRLGECHAVLADVLTLVQRSPELRDEQLRAALVAVADRAAGLLEGGTR